MHNSQEDQSFRTYFEEISNKDYLKLLERYILFDELSNLDIKNREWN